MKPIIKKSFLLISLLLSTSVFADNTAPKFDCTLTDQMSADGKPSSAKDNFSVSTPMIYLMCQSGEVKKGQKISTTWIAADTHNVAPENYKIAEKSFDITSNPPQGKVWILNASMSKPTKGWPVGSYHVDVYVDNVMSQSVKFSIK